MQINRRADGMGLMISTFSARGFRFFLRLVKVVDDKLAVSSFRFQLETFCEFYNAYFGRTIFVLAQHFRRWQTVQSFYCLCLSLSLVNKFSTRTCRQRQLEQDIGKGRAEQENTGSLTQTTKGQTDRMCKQQQHTTENDI